MTNSFLQGIFHEPLWLPIVFCFVLALIIFIAKLVIFFRERSNVNELVTGLLNTLKKNKMTEAITLCENTPGPVARLLSSAVYAHQQHDDIRNAMEIQAMIDVHQIESGFNLFQLITFITPLVGLFTTTIKLASFIRGTSNIQQVSLNIAQAFIFSAAALAIAVLCHVAHALLVSFANNFFHDMEIASAEIIYFFEHPEGNHDASEDKR